MPVTFAHPAAVLVLRWTPLPMSALVIGSMVPDVPLFVPWLPVDYAFTHTALGIVTVNVLLGTLGWLLWTVVLCAPLTDAAPTWLRRRLPPPSGRQAIPSGAPLLLVPVAVAIGAATHALWDELTHVGRWGEAHIPWLAASHAGLPGYKWAQYVSGVGGIILIAAVVALLLHRAEPRQSSPRRRPHLAPWIVGAPVAAAVTVLIGILATATGDSLRGYVYTLITQGTSAAAVTLLLACLLWHLPPQRRASTPDEDDRQPARRIRSRS